jgi:hypothetical protein
MKRETAMSEVVDERVRELVRGSSPETKEMILLDLVSELMTVHAEEPDLPIHVAARTFLDALARLAAEDGRQPPTAAELAEAERNREYIRKRLKLTPEDEAELERRRRTLDDVVSVDDVIRRLRTVAPIGTS